MQGSILTSPLNYIISGFGGKTLKVILITDYSLFNIWLTAWIDELAYIFSAFFSLTICLKSYLWDSLSVSRSNHVWKIQCKCHFGKCVCRLKWKINEMIMNYQENKQSF